MSRKVYVLTWSESYRDYKVKVLGVYATVDASKIAIELFKNDYTNIECSEWDVPLVEET